MSEKPVIDQGRLALLAGPRPGCASSCRSPSRADIRTVEIRRIFLAADPGKGRLVKTARFRGSFRSLRDPAGGNSNDSF